MPPQDPQTAAPSLLAHAVSQIEINVNFLVSQNYISRSDASVILNKLPNVNVTPSQSSGGFPRRATRNRVRGSNMGSNLSRSPAQVRGTVCAPRSLFQARALWAYNAEDASDLAFSPGDVIRIVEETNADWWTGRLNGKQGLFPSTYVERLAPLNRIPTAPATSPGPITTTVTEARTPFGAGLHETETNAPPPYQL